MSGIAVRLSAADWMVVTAAVDARAQQLRPALPMLAGVYAGVSQRLDDAVAAALDDSPASEGDLQVARGALRTLGQVGGES